MLNIWFGNVLDGSPNYVYNTSNYFDLNYEDEWITSGFSRAVIKDIDKSDVIAAKIIDSPVLGPIPPVSIAGGTKTIILMRFDDTGKIFNASTCGDNCAKWIQKIAEEKDLTIRLGHFMDFSNPINVKVMNTGEIITDDLDLLTVYHKIVLEGD